MNDIVKHQGALPAHFQPQVLSAQMDYARALAESNLLPKQYFKQPANLLWAISYGQTLGVDPMTAVQSIHVINGKPTASADLIAGLVRRAGHKLRITGDDRKAVAQIIRADDPDFTFEVVWTIERAHAAKLTSKDTWKQFPAAMLKARAITEVARAACSEILQGTIYTPEELGAVVDQDGNPVDAPVQPLRSVQAETYAEQEGDLSGGRDFINEATEASDAQAVRAVWQAAKQAGAAAHVLNEIVAVGKEKAAAEYEAPAATDDDEDVTDAETVDDGTDEHAAAVAELRQFATEHGIDDIDAAAYPHLGAPLDDVSASAIRALTAQLRSTAA